MKKLYSLLFAFLVIINIMLCITVLKLKDKRNSAFNSNDTFEVTNCLASVIFNSDLPLNPFQIVKTESDSIITLERLINSPKLIYFYNESSCSPCTDNELHKLDSLTAIIGSDNVLLMTRSSSARSISLLKRAYRLNFQSILFEELPEFPIIKFPINFYFILDSEFRTKLFYVPSPNYESINKIYYSAIVDFFKPIARG